MNIMMEIPNGYVLIKKGGRPPKFARDIAVFLMKFLWCKVRKEKVVVFEEEAIKLFDFSDGADVRKSVKKSGEKIKEDGLRIFSSGDDVTAQPGPARASSELKGQKCWSWSVGDKRAFEARYK